MASPPILDDPNHSARRAKTRIAVAGVLLTIAIGGLTLLSRQQQTVEQTETPAPQKQESISSGEPPVADQEPAPAQINSSEQELPQPLPPAPPVEAPTAPTTPVEAVTPPPPPPPVVTNPKPTNRTTSPAPVLNVPRDNSPVPSEPIPPVARPVEKPFQKTSEPPLQKVTPAPPNPAVAAKPIPAARSYDVQVGVFTDMENARQLQAKLAEHGIPSHTETKLQVGPFASKAEADAAREKLKNLGIGSVVIPGK